jgi:hypothetical protein
MIASTFRLPKPSKPSQKPCRISLTITTPSLTIEFPGFNINHIVLGSNSIFLAKTKNQQGNITQENDVLLRNGRKFFKDFLKQRWGQSYSLRDHLGAERLGGLSIKPILCFSRGFVEICGPVRGVEVRNVHYLRPYILAQEGNVLTQTRDQIIPKPTKSVSNQAAQPNSVSPSIPSRRHCLPENDQSEEDNV